MKRLPIGISDFKELREQDCYYVDKTLFIKEFLESSGKVLLIPRPRRFGKTLNLSTLRYFFEKTAKNNSHLFEGTAIWHDEKVRAHQGNYPVIFLTFKDVKESTWAVACAKLKKIISAEYVRHSYLQELSLSGYEAEQFRNLMFATASEEEYHGSLFFLTDLLHRYHAKPTIVLLDEYDSPIHAAVSEGYYRESVAFIRSLLAPTLKDNNFLHRAALTGILRTAKEGMFSGLNNLKVCTLLRDEFADKFGFTAAEVDQLLHDQGIAYQADQIKAWYNGYHVGKTTLVYNPWSILACADNKGLLQPYWVNTSDNELAKNLIAKSPAEVKTELENLLSPDAPPLIKEIEEAFIFPTLENNPLALWSLLLFSGYLTYTQRELTQDSGVFLCTLTIPNQEVRSLYRRFLVDILSHSLKSQRLESMLRSFVQGETEAFESGLQEFILDTMSCYDIADNEPERSYHLFILGLFIALEPTYRIQSNREAGFGRYDIMFIPRDTSKPGIIIEFKKTATREKETVQQAAARALAQIKKKNYAHELRAQGITTIVAYGIGVQGKEVFVEVEKSL